MNLPTESDAAGPLPRGAGRAAIVLATVWVVGFLGVALARVGHPFELDWMGGAFADHVCRVLDGEPLYVEPSADYVPFLYAPLYFYVSAGVALFTGEGFLAMRAVSIASTLGILALAGWWTLQRTASRAAAAVVVGTYAGGYFLVDTYYDSARADGLFVFLALGALVTLDRGDRRRSALTAAALLVLAYSAKQTALLLAPPFAIGIALRDPRRAAWFAVGFAVLWGVSFAALDMLHGGWYSFYTWTLPRRHQYDWSIALDALWIDLRPLWPLFGVSVWLLVRRLRAGQARELLVDGAWTGGLLLASLSSRAHLGGALNVLAPGVLALGLIGGLAWRDALRAGGRTAAILPLVLVAQLALLVVDLEDRDDRHAPRLIDPSRYVPTVADRAAGERIVELLREADGDVLVPWHGYLPRMAGKRGGAHLMALIDLETERSGEPELWERLLTEFRASARVRNADLVLLDEDLGMPHYRMAELVYPGYVPEGRIFPAEDTETFVPVVGLRTRPTTIWRRAR